MGTGVPQGHKNKVSRPPTIFMISRTQLKMMLYFQMMLCRQWMRYNIKLSLAKTVKQMGTGVPQGHKNKVSRPPTIFMISRTQLKPKNH